MTPKHSIALRRSFLAPDEPEKCTELLELRENPEKVVQKRSNENVCNPKW
jgi:hypothetical protein